jgi:hypothetical protein
MIAKRPTPSKKSPPKKPTPKKKVGTKKPEVKKPVEKPIKVAKIRQGSLACNIVPFAKSNDYNPEVYFSFDGQRYALTKFGVRGASRLDDEVLMQGGTADTLIFKGLLELQRVN